MSIISIDGSDVNGYRLHTTSPMAAMFWATRSARCSGRSRSARMPPWMAGWSVFTRPPSISGLPVTSSTGVHRMPASVSAAAVPPLETSSQPSRDSPRANSTRPVLS